MSSLDEFMQNNAIPEHDLPQNAGPTYKFLQWVEPVPGAQGFLKTGGFFLPEDQFPIGFEAPRPLDEAAFDSGSTKAGLGYPKIGVAVLAYRLDWFVHDESTNRRQFYASYKEAAANGKPRGRTRYAVLVANDELWRMGPFMLTVSGVKGKHLQQALTEFDAAIRQPFMRIRKQHVPPYFFWAPLMPGSRMDASKTFSSAKIVPPKLALPDQYDPLQMAQQLFVGPDVIRAAEQYWTEAQNWAKAKIGGEFGEPQDAEPGAEELGPLAGGSFPGQAGAAAPKPGFGGKGQLRSDDAPWL